MGCVRRPSQHDLHALQPTEQCWLYNHLPALLFSIHVQLTLETISSCWQTLITLMDHVFPFHMQLKIKIYPSLAITDEPSCSFATCLPWPCYHRWRERGNHVQYPVPQLHPHIVTKPLLHFFDELVFKVLQTSHLTVSSSSEMVLRQDLCGRLERDDTLRRKWICCSSSLLPFTFSQSPKWLFFQFRQQEQGTPAHWPMCHPGRPSCWASPGYLASWTFCSFSWIITYSVS